MLRQAQQPLLIIKIIIKMHEEKNHTSTGSVATKVELQVIPCANKVALNHNHSRVMNHESQDDPCTGKLILTITCDGSKLTKADAGRFNEVQEELWVTLKTTKADAGKLPDIDLSIHERCGSKLTKADSGKTI